MRKAERSVSKQGHLPPHLHSWPCNYTTVKWPIKIIFYVTGQKIRYKKVLPRYWTGSRSRKEKDKAVSFRQRFRKNTPAVSVVSRARLNQAQNWCWENHCFILNLRDPINKMFLRLIYFKNSTFPRRKITVDTLIDVRNETSKHHFSNQWK